MAKNIITEYLYSMKPDFNSAEWKATSGLIDALLAGNSKQLKKFNDGVSDYQKNLANVTRLAKKSKQSGLGLDGLRSSDTADKIRGLFKPQGRFNPEKKSTSQEGPGGKTPGDKKKIEQLSLIDQYNKAFRKVPSNMRELGEFLSEIKQRRADKAAASGGGDSGGGFKKLGKVFGKVGGIFATGMGKTTGVMQGISSVVGKIGGWVGAIVEIIKKIYNSTVGIANKFVSKDSMFVDENTKSIMARLGVTAEEAQAVQAGLDGANLSLESFGSATEGQIKLFERQRAAYKENLDKMDPEKLKNFNQEVQNMQAKLKEHTQKMFGAIMKIFVGSKQLSKVFATMGETMDLLIEIMESPAIQAIMDVLLWILNVLMKITNFILKIINGFLKLFGKKNRAERDDYSDNSTKNVNITSNYYGGGGSQTAADEYQKKLAMQIANVMS